MNKMLIVITSLVVCSLLGTAYGIPKESEEGSTSWHVYGSIMEHPEDSFLFTYGDIFVLQKIRKHPNRPQKISIKLKPFKMKNSEWKKYKSNGLDFEIYSPSGIEYYCATNLQLNHDSSDSRHAIVISPLAGHNGDYIAIQFRDLPSDVPEDFCDNVTLPSHGGLAHAHRVS